MLDFMKFHVFTILPMFLEVFLKYIPVIIEDILRCCSEHVRLAALTVFFNII